MPWKNLDHEQVVFGIDMGTPEGDQSAFAIARLASPGVPFVMEVIDPKDFFREYERVRQLPWERRFVSHSWLEDRPSRLIRIWWWFKALYWTARRTLGL